MREKLGVNPDEFNFGQTRRILDKYFDRINRKLCTVKQIALLRRHGVDATEFSFARARVTIDAIAQNGWKLPKVLPAEPAQTNQPRVAERGELAPEDVPF